MTTTTTTSNCDTCSHVRICYVWRAFADAALLIPTDEPMAFVESRIAGAVGGVCDKYHHQKI